jgi:hypothetical protein
LVRKKAGYVALAAVRHTKIADRWSQRHITPCATEDLKMTLFKPEYTGKMNFYLSAVDDMLRHPEDKPSIGLILCKTKNQLVAEYAIRDLAKALVRRIPASGNASKTAQRNPSDHRRDRGGAVHKRTVGRKVMFHWRRRMANPKTFSTAPIPSGIF